MTPMTQHLVLTIRFHAPRYHGTADWPPAPARVFQALVAGVARGNTLPAESARALAWLERLPPPIIAAPRMRTGSRVELFVPNNDADAVGGDPANIGEIRVKKVVLPRLLEEGTPLLYAWELPPSASEHAPGVVEAAESLYQLGRGIDMAWRWARSSVTTRWRRSWRRTAGGSTGPAPARPSSRSRAPRRDRSRA